MPRHFDVRGLARYSEPRAFVALKKSGHQVAQIFMFVDIEVYLIIRFPPRLRRPFIRTLALTGS